MRPPLDKAVWPPFPDGTAPRPRGPTQTLP